MSNKLNTKLSKPRLYVTYTDAHRWQLCCALLIINFKEYIGL